MVSEGDYFRYLSKSIKIQECYLHVAYTQNNKFYLIGIKKNGTLYV